ncbi:uncharacterized protein B4U80_09841 [Leptotrombidium deliense]|uniref:CUB domain-containing protein n=1 Tax=Leptotrombidium deliense TaxID=299467 RepID=A0A443S6G3_9ACAR|nr:uncharacterized protein B4U80_09841 [Leptotrombidium deliense]
MLCFLVPRTCGQSTTLNQTYFVNPGHPSYFNATTSCQLTINRARNTKLGKFDQVNMCQLRLDFIDFDLNQPSYVYIDIEDTNGPYNVRVITRGTGNRRWNIRVTFIECRNELRAPLNCLQYFASPSGQFESFNYVDANQIQVASSALEETDAYTYLNNMDYAICFRKEAGFCTQTYTVNTTYTPFALINVAPNGSPLFDTTTAGTGLLKCPFDYLLLSGIRLCGSHLNPFAVNQSPNYDTPVIDISSGPFIARFSTNNAIAGRVNTLLLATV